MKLYDKVIFVDENGTCRAPMAAEIFKDIAAGSGIEACPRGLVVLFPEPLNQKAEAVMALTALGYSSSEAFKALDGIEITKDMEVETLLKQALKKMAIL